jgi:endogenous inhibitor of DNA gyrase (YacG/DUF329 family)
MTGKDLICPKCRKAVARNIDDVYLIIGNIRFWEKVRFTCGFCHKPIRWKPKDVDLHSFEGETKKILNQLGLENKYREERNKGTKQGKR